MDQYILYCMHTRMTAQLVRCEGTSHYGNPSEPRISSTAIVGTLPIHAPCLLRSTLPQNSHPPHGRTYTPVVRDVGKAREVLTRIGIGLSANPTVTESEMLLYVHATVAPFLFPQVC